MEIWGDILKDYGNRKLLENMQKVKEENKALVIYGAGKRCLSLLKKFEKYNIQIKGIAVTDTLNNPQSIRQYSVNVIEKYDKDDTIVISLADRDEAGKIKNILCAKGYNKMYFVNDCYALEKDFL